MTITHQPGRCRRDGLPGCLLAAVCIAAASPAWAAGAEGALPTSREIGISDAALPSSNAPVALSALPASNSPTASTNAFEGDFDSEADEGADGASTNEFTIATPAMLKMYEALFNVQDKYYDIAIPKLEWVIAEDPTLMAAWQALGWAYWGTGRKDDAQKLWERLQMLAPNEPLSYNCLAMTAAETNDTVRASALYRKSLELNPDQDDIRRAYYRTLIWQGQYTEAIPGLAALLKRDPDRIDVRLELAKALASHQDYDGALAQWNIICEQFPDNVEYAVDRAQNLLYAGDLDLANEEAQRILEMDPNNVKALSLMADIAEFSNKPDDAAKELRKIADRTEDKFLRSKILYRLTMLLFEMHATNPEDYPIADIIAVAKEGLDCDPRAVDMRLTLGELLSVDQQYVAAWDVFEKVLKDFNGNSLRAKRGLIEICLARGQYDEAQSRLEDRLERFDQYDPYHYYDLARLEFARGNYFDALQMLDRLEEEGARGAVFTLLYHGLSDIEWTSKTSVRMIGEHLKALKRAGFKFVAPDQISAYFERLPKLPENKTEPILSRWWQWISYGFTGENKPVSSSLRAYHPEKVVCVTFDDGQRSSLLFGTPIAEELDTRFGLSIPVCGIDQHNPLAASWDELHRYEATGRWTYGSQLLYADIPAPIDAQGYLAYPLPNQIWVPARNRQETLSAYLSRIRREFKASRETIIKEVGLKTNDCRMVAYPHGDIGQAAVCNVQNVDNICKTIRNEARMNYDMGFIQSRFGYAVNGDNPLLYQRYEPDRRKSGQDVVQQAFENHPVFLARRMRAKIAALQGKPNLAEEMLAELSRDGYPDNSIEELSAYVRERLAGEIQAPQKVATESKREARWLSLEHPFIGGDFSSTRDNVVIDEWHLKGRAGVNLNPRLTVEAIGGIGNIQQTITTITPITLQTTTMTTNRVVTITTSGGSNTYRETSTVNIDQTTVKTNMIYTEDFQADEKMAGLRLSYRIPGGTLLFGELRQRTFTAKSQTNWQETITNINGMVVTNIGPATFTDDSEIVGAFEIQGKPLLAMDVAARFEHDVIPSAHSIITYNSGGLRGAWRIYDWWNLDANGVYTLLSDSNTMLRMGANTEWLLSEKHCLYAGMQYQFITAEDASIEYWTPYWQQRFYFTARMQRSYFNNYATVRARMGWTKELLRPEEEQINPDQEQLWIYNPNTGTLTQRHANPAQESPGWNPVVGLDASLRRNIFRHLDIYGQFSVNFLQDFTERSFVVGLIYDFEGRK